MMIFGEPTWFGVWWDGNKPPHHPWGLLHRGSPTHPFIILGGWRHQLSHQDPLQAAVVHALPQPSSTRKPAEQTFSFFAPEPCGQQNTATRSILFKNIRTCKCAPWSRCGPQRTPPATLRRVLSYRDPSALWSASQGSGTDTEVYLEHSRYEVTFKITNLPKIYNNV